MVLTRSVSKQHHAEVLRVTSKKRKRDALDALEFVDILPDDLWLHIFETIAKTKRGIEFVFLTLARVSRRFKHLTEILPFNLSLNLRARTLRIFLDSKSCDNLWKLDLSTSNTGAKITNNDLIRLGQCCKNLKHLSLTIKARDDRLSDYALAKLLRSLPKLESFDWDIDTLTSLFPISLITILRYCPKLKSLAWRDGFCPNAEFFSGLLRLAFPPREPGKYPVMELESIDFASVEYLSTQFLDFLSHAAPKLHTLRICECDNITDELISHPMDRCPIQVLALHEPEISTNMLATLTRHGARMKELTLTNIYQRMDLLQFEQVVKSMNNLTKFDMFEVLGMNDDILFALADSCPNLKSLGFPHCREITEDGLAYVTQRCKLVELNCNSTELDGFDYQASIPDCPDLELMSAADLVAADVLCEQLALHCPGLKHLEIPHTDVTDDGIDALTKGCTNLESIDLTVCMEVTDVGFKHLATRCPKLKIIRIGKQHDFSRQLLNQYRSLVELDNGWRRYTVGNDFRGFQRFWEDGADDDLDEEGEEHLARAAVAFNNFFALNPLMLGPEL